jgi:hypothetical protein
MKWKTFFRHWFQLIRSKQVHSFSCVECILIDFSSIEMTTVRQQFIFVFKYRVTIPLRVLSHTKYAAVALLSQHHIYSY